MTDAIRSSFVAQVAGGRADGTEDWDTRSGAVAAAINQTIESALGEGYATATVTKKGETLWDINAKDLMGRLASKDVVESALTKEQKATLAAAANILGPTGAMRVYEKDGMAGLVKAVTAFKGGKLADEINALDAATKDLYAAFPVASPSPAGATTSPGATESGRTGGTTAATPAKGTTTSAADPVAAARTAIGDAATSTSLTARATAARDSSAAVKAAMLDRRSLGGDNIQLALRALNAAKTLVTDIETQITAVNAAPNSADKTTVLSELNGLKRTASAAVTQLNAMYTELSAPIDLSAHTNTALAAMKARDKAKGEEYVGDYNIPETWMRLNAGTFGLKPDANDAEIRKYIKDNEADVANAYAKDIMENIQTELGISGYTQAALSGHLRTHLPALITSIFKSAETAAYDNGGNLTHLDKNDIEGTAVRDTEFVFDIAPLEAFHAQRGAQKTTVTAAA